MKVFIIKNESQVDGAVLPQVEYAPTMGDAHKVARDTWAKACWPEITVQEVDIQVDKQGVLAALAGKPIILNVMRTWGLTNRGALTEER